MSHDPTAPDDPTPDLPDTPMVHTSDPAEATDDAPPNEPVVDDAPPEEAEAPMEALPLRGTARPEPAASRAPSDPMAQANEVLARAAAARGAEFEPPRTARRSPLEAAQEALEKALAAREHAAAGGSRGLAREAAARAQLDQLKRMGGQPAPPSEAPPGTPAPSDGPPTPRKRRL